MRVERLQHMGDALVDRHATAEAEDEHGHHQRVEVDLFAVAERVPVVRGLFALLQAHEQQAAVARVDQRVDALGQHRRRAADPRRDELGDGDGEVADDGGVDRFLAGSHVMGCGLRVSRYGLWGGGLERKSLGPETCNPHDGIVAERRRRRLPRANGHVGASRPLVVQRRSVPYYVVCSFDTSSPLA